MSGCRSCSGCSTEPNYAPPKTPDKLEKGERSGNPRYPHVFVGKQAIYSDDQSSMIVTVLEDKCDDECDRFTLKPQTILQDKLEQHSTEEAFDVSQPAGQICWKLHALI